MENQPMERTAERSFMKYLLILLMATTGLAAASICVGQDSATVSEEMLESCGPLREVATAEGRLDYRLKDTSPVVKKGVQDLNRYHTQLAADELRQGSLHLSVIQNLDFSLRHSPNHHWALQLLIQYDRAGGKFGSYPPPECAFLWARQHAPDDYTVWFLGGYYYWSRKQYKNAEYWYQRALMLEPNLADGHYNLGLLYIDMAEYDKALKHAHSAYALGYPLPGLKQKLQRLGKWREPEPDKTSATQ